MRVAIGVAIACRIPLAVGPVNFDSDMGVRWDGRAQRFGYNPYEVVLADPALAHTHTTETVRMPSRHARERRTPAAQLIFSHGGAPRIRAGHEGRAHRGRHRDDLPVVEVAAARRVERVAGAHLRVESGDPRGRAQGHIDALGTFWIVAAAYWMAHRHRALAIVAYTLAVATKLLPIVLAPLFIAACACAISRSAPPCSRRSICRSPSGRSCRSAPCRTWSHTSVSTVQYSARWRGSSHRDGPRRWHLIAIAAAVWARVKLDINDPASWAWPMALALVCAPVIYPWAFTATTSFGRSTVPLLVWTYSVIPVYSYGSGRFTGRVDRAERADADRIRRRFAVNGSAWRLSARGTPIPKPSYQN